MTRKEQNKRNVKNWMMKFNSSWKIMTMLSLLIYYYYIQSKVYIQAVSAAYMNNDYYFYQTCMRHNRKLNKNCFFLPDVVAHGNSGASNGCNNCMEYSSNCQNKNKIKKESNVILYSASTLKNNDDMFSDDNISDDEMDDDKEENGKSKQHLTGENVDGTHNNNMEIDVSLEDISDEEALLACHSYLLRRKRLPWKAHERRKSMLEKSRNQSGVGYFWDDPDELIFLRKNKNLISRLSTKNSDKYYYEDKLYSNEPKKQKNQHGNFSTNKNNESEDNLELSPGSRRGGYQGNDPLFIQDYDAHFDSNHINNDDLFRDIFQEERNEAVDDDDTGDFFSIHPLHPSSAHVRRSEAKKRLFQDKEWKQRWYQRRWGKSSNNNSTRKHNDEQKLVKAIPANILRSSEFATLSEDEIEQAIITYVMANRRRRQTFQVKYEQKQDEKKRQKQQQQQRHQHQPKLTSDNLNAENEPYSTTIKENKKFLNLDKNRDSALNRNKTSIVTPFTVLSPNDTDSNIHNKQNKLSSSNFDKISPNVNEDEISQQVERALREAQRKRSERAKKAYQTHLRNLSNMENKRSKTVSTHLLGNKSSKPQHSFQTAKSIPQKDIHKQIKRRHNYRQDKLPKTAIDRVGQCVLLSSQRGPNHLQYPNPIDIVSILRPLRLGRRKSLLQQILDTFFTLRGKCVPDIMSSRKVNNNSNDSEMEDQIATIIYDDDIDSEKYKSAMKYIFNKYDEAEKMKDNGHPVNYKFVTKCTNHELGLFVLYLLDNKK